MAMIFIDSYLIQRPGLCKSSIIVLPGKHRGTGTGHGNSLPESGGDSQLPG